MSSAIREYRREDAGKMAPQGCEIRAPRFVRNLAAMVAFGLAPLVLWAIGTAIVRVAPPVFRSEALVKLPANESAGNPLATPEVFEIAARSLAAGGRKDPMAEQVLRSNLSQAHAAGPGMFRVAANGHDPHEARRALMAVIESYESIHAGSEQRLLVYAAPPEPLAVPHGMRMVLGCAGVASLGLLLSIPLLSRLESFSAIARASATAGFPPGAGCLPAAQPAG